MHPRLDEIRKRLLTPPVSSTPARYKALARTTEVSSPVPNPSEERLPLDSEPTATTEEDLAVPNSSQGTRINEPTAAPDLGVAEAGSEVPKSTDGLARAVAELFEPARQCQGRLLEITRASEAISDLTILALELREPLKSFHDHIRKLSSSFESMRTFRDELGLLAESFAPVRALHQQVIQMAHTVRTHLAEVANGLEPAKALKVEIADLAAAIDSVSELQARFYELSEAFGNAGDSSPAAEMGTAPEHSGMAEVK